MSLHLLQTAFMLPAEQFLNRLLAMDAAGPARLRAMEGKVLAVHAVSPRVACFISVRNGRLHLSALHEGPADATLKGSAANLLRLLAAREPVSNLAPYDVELSGSTGFVQSLQRLLKDLNVDWQYHLSLLIGDLPVAGIDSALQSGRRFAGSALHSTTYSLRDYLVHESALVPSPEAAERFYQEISELELRLDRLQARIGAFNSPTLK